MQIYVLKDYEEHTGRLIQQTLHSDYTLTGYYTSSQELQWVLHYTGSRDTTLFEIALSEYIIDQGTVETIWDSPDLDGGIRYYKRR